MPRTREQIYDDMEETFGLVPVMFREVPDATLELEWQLFKKLQMEEGPIPNKYKELMGIAISGATKCQYCTFYHTELAKLNGATPQEIEDAVHYAKCSVGWSTYMNGLQIDFDQFKAEVRQACDHIRQTQLVGVSGIAL